MIRETGESAKARRERLVLLVGRAEPAAGECGVKDQVRRPQPPRLRKTTGRV